MLNGVTLMGLVAGPVTVQGPDGPVTLTQEPAAPLAVFRLEGWEPGDAPGGQEDETQGHKVLRIMESVGQAVADDHITPEDLEALASALSLPGAAAIGIILAASRRLIEALANDGKVSPTEALAIVGAILRQAGLTR